MNSVLFSTNTWSWTGNKNGMKGKVFLYLTLVVSIQILCLMIRRILPPMRYAHFRRMHDLINIELGMLMVDLFIFRRLIQSLFPATTYHHHHHTHAHHKHNEQTTSDVFIVIVGCKINASRMAVEVSRMIAYGALMQFCTLN